ncbi:hypothetical protein GTR02_05730 [Kineococcus sp. R8]|uniref:hypothetical protein n=1 Tax=Kineococcus siccus TaxID=2696567 RepID=UPI001412AC04|nr:hypothetical protein [Kineococcus siccus]NAZ81311.1 hypothetical protein [Kineococcus siccus]
MLDQAVQWVARNTRRRIAFGSDGHGRDEPEHPRLAVRELIANALVHRDVGPHALGEAVTLRRWAGAGDGRRVIEELRQAGMTPPRFFDQGIRFAVRVPHHTLLRQQDLTWLAEQPATRWLSDVQRHALVEMKNAAVFTNGSFREVFPMDSTEAHRALRELVDTGSVVPEGEKRARRSLFADRGHGRGRAGATASGEVLTARQLDRVEGRTTSSGTKVTRNGDLVLAALAGGSQSRDDVVRATGLTPRQVTYALRLLVEGEVIVIDGGPGRRGTTYRLTAATADPGRARPSSVG